MTMARRPPDTHFGIRTHWNEIPYSKGMKRITVHHLGEQRYVGINESGQQVILDGSPLSVGLRPMEALLASLAACTAYDVVEIMNKRKTPLVHYRVEVEGMRAEEHPKRYTEISVKHIAHGPEELRSQLEKAAHLSHEKYCSVAATLNCPIHLSVSIEDLL